MRAARYHQAGGPEVLNVEEVDRQKMKDDEITIEVEAASINPVDAKRRAAGSGPLPKTTGSDFAGTVVGVGSTVESFEVGDRVFGTGLHTNRFSQGGFSEFVSVPTDIVAHLPSSVSFDDGAAVALVGVTAWRALVDHATVSPTESCLIHGGSGGVGHIAVQLADAMGASVCATARPEFHDTVRTLGAETVVDYDREDLLEVLDQRIGGADVVVDHRLDDYFQFDVDIANVGGRIVNYGGQTGTISDALGTRGKELRVFFMSMSNCVIRDDTPSIGRVLQRIARLLEEKVVTPHVARVYDLEEAPEIHRAVMEDSFVGKLVVHP